MASKNDAIEAIKNYPDYERDYHKRELEIKYPFDAYPDENINGGKAQNVRDESTEDAVYRLIDDPVLNYLDWQKNAVEGVLKQCVDKQVRSLLDKGTYDIIYEFYFRETQIYNAEGIAQKVGLSRSGMYKRKDAFINAVQEELSKVDKKWTITQK